MKGGIIIFILTVSLCFIGSGCTKDPVASSRETILFGVTEEECSVRSAITDMAALKKYGFIVSANLKSPSISRQTFMESQKISFTQDDGWGYSPIKYWPTEEGSTLDFYPAYTDSSQNVTIRYDWYNKPQTTVKLNTSVADQTDFLWAPPVTGVAYRDLSDGVVAFHFHHALSCILFSMRLNEELSDCTVKVNSVSISGSFHMSADINPDKTDIDDIFTYRDDKKDVTFKISSSRSDELAEASKTVSTTTAEVTGTKGAMMFFPCGKQEFMITLEYTVTSNGVDEDYSFQFHNQELDFRSGVAHRITFILDKSFVSTEVSSQPLSPLPGEEL